MGHPASLVQPRPPVKTIPFPAPSPAAFMHQHAGLLARPATSGYLRRFR